jgi:hypothetical protein
MAPNIYNRGVASILSSRYLWLDMTRSLTAAVAFLVANACQKPRDEGPPARLVAGTSDTVLVNNLRPVPIPVRVLDAAGRVLPDTAVRFQWTGGAEVPLSVDGMVTCSRAGDATVRASIGNVATSALVRCRPVQILGVQGPVNIVLGDSARDLPVVALGPDGAPVDLLDLTVIVRDSSVAAMDGHRLRARASGSTMVEVRAGDQSGGASAKVYQPVTTLDGLRRDQEHVAVPLRLASGEVRRWRIPAGGYMFWMLPYEYEGRGLQIRLEGANCEPAEPQKPVSGGFAFPPRFTCLATSDASVIVAHPSRASSAPALAGVLLLRRLDL